MTADRDLKPSELSRYSRQLLLPELGLEGQLRLKAARVLLVGAGGLGVPAALYLAGAGVGKLRILDGDNLELSNLQRQVIYRSQDIGRPKAELCAEHLRRLNGEIQVEAVTAWLTAANALALIEDCDLVIDGSDNYPTRYLLNDACVLLNKPLIYGSIYQFDGQVSLFHHAGGPCYRCLYPTAPAPGTVPSCAEGGVLGVLPGVIGVIQATEALKLILGLGDSLSGRLLLYDARTLRFDELRLARNPHCPLCGDQPSIHALQDYEVFCAAAPASAAAVASISPQALQQWLAQQPDLPLIDVREAFETQLCSLPNALHLPLRQLESGAQPEALAALDRSQDLVLYCRSGERSARACALLQQWGFEQPRTLAGGILAWAAEIDPSLRIY